MGKRMTLEQFQNPPKAYREAPFWSWNDDLDPEESAGSDDLVIM